MEICSNEAFYMKKNRAQPPSDQQYKMKKKYFYQRKHQIKIVTISRFRRIAIQLFFFHSIKNSTKFLKLKRE